MLIIGIIVELTLAGLVIYGAIHEKELIKLEREIADEVRGLRK